MKKILSLILTLTLVFLFAFGTHAEQGKEELSFDSDGKFKIMQINDTQDTHNMNQRTAAFIKKAIEIEKPDLVVIVGDMLSDFYPFANEEKITKALNCLADIMSETKTPFAVTFGNHDHDLEDVLSTKEMMNVLLKNEYCVSATDGCDAGTYNIPILTSDKSGYALNVYMMDTNNKNKELGGYQGVYSYQVDWYKEKSDELKNANSGKTVPSIVFQHIPPKEVYQLLKVVDRKQAADAVYSTKDGNWYKLNEDKIIDFSTGLGEAPCSEKLDITTGQYEAWLEKGDIIGAFFGHDHVNNFVGKTDDGIILGYNGGTGFNTYGSANKRSVRIYEFEENDVENYNTRSVYYDDILDDGCNFYIIDLFSASIVNWLLRAVYKMFFIIPWCDA